MNYPKLVIDTDWIYKNAQLVNDICSKNWISTMAVVKWFEAIPEVVEKIINSWYSYVASSRMRHLKKLQNLRKKIPLVLIRIPQISELEEVVENCDYSLESELDTIKKLNEICKQKNKEHKIILMLDVWDLREWFWDEAELFEAVKYTQENLKNIKIVWIWTNVWCYWAVVPNNENLWKLSQVAEQIEEIIWEKLEIISGWATSSLTILFNWQKLPEKINNLRIWEAILLNRDLPDIWKSEIPGMVNENFTLQAQIIEIKNKPSHPVWELFIDAFGNKPIFDDRWIRKRALLAVWKADFVYPDQLIPRFKWIEILGASSDHLIVDIENYDWELNIWDILEFDMYYWPMLHLSISADVEKVLK